MTVLQKSFWVRQGDGLTAPRAEDGRKAAAGRIPADLGDAVRRRGAGLVRRCRRIGDRGEVPLPGAGVTRASSNASRGAQRPFLRTLAAAFVVAFLVTGAAFAGTRERLSLDSGW